MHTWKRWFALIVVLGAMAAPALATNQGFDVELFHPAIFNGNFLAIEDAGTMCPWSFGAGLYLDYARSPLTVFLDNDPKFEFMSHLYSAHLTLAGGISDWFGVGVEIPGHFASARKVKDLGTLAGLTKMESVFRLGDIKAEVKFRALRQEKHWLSLSVAPYVTFGTGAPNLFLGEGRITGGGTLILEHDFKAIDLALNVGYDYRRQSRLLGTDVADAVKWGAGLSRDFNNGVGFSVEYWGSWFKIKNEKVLKNDPMEITATLRYRFGARLPRIIAAGGPGLTHGLGTPAYRFVLGAEYKWCRQEPTDGTLDVKAVGPDDKPLAVSLELVGPDGRSTTVDTNGAWKRKLPAGKYTLTAMKEGYIPAAFRPVVKVGQTTLVAAKLRAKEVPPPPPTLLFLDLVDKASGAKLDGEIIVGPQTPQEKKIALPTGELNQVWAPGAFRIQATAKGYETTWTDVTVVAEKNNRVVIQLRKKIELIDKIYFGKDSDVILPKSKPVLDDVIQKIKALGAFKKIVIEGHCSIEGSDEYNMTLSQKRTEAVKAYLVKHGIDAAKLEPIGYGKTRFIAPNDTEENRSLNRRVEFILEE